MAVTDERPTEVPAGPVPSRSWLSAVLVVVLAVALVAAGGALASQQTDRPAMGWMSADHAGMAGMNTGGAMRMPGMATPAEMARLRSLTGRTLDVYFLQLLIRHHQGGIPMAREGADRASLTYVRTLASAIVNSQSAEVVTLERMLRERGGQPLPPP